MAGFFRKVAGAFVELDDGAGESSAGADGSTGGGSRRSGGGLDAITDDAAALLAQLEPHPTPGQPWTPRPTPATGSSHSVAAASAGVPEGSALGMNADDVFVAAGLADGPNSAERLLRLIAGLKMFPAEQQVVMIRAMDAADDTWAEGAVLEDARTRQSVLRGHLQAIEDERGTRLASLQTRIDSTRAEGASICEDIDRRIAELQQKRKQAVEQTDEVVAGLEGELRALEADAERARRGVTQVINALSSLIGFFGGPVPGAQGGSGAAAKGQSGPRRGTQ